MSNTLIDGRASCSHIPEPHIVYNHRAAAYRAAVNCRCGYVKAETGRLYTKLAAAESAACALMQLAEGNRA